MLCCSTALNSDRKHIQKDIKLINTALSDSPDFRSDKENPAGKT